jgi:capsular exopolysaccharide synthesis family protein
MASNNHNPWESNGSSNGHPAAEVKTTSTPRSFDIDFRRVFTMWPYMIGATIVGVLVAYGYLRYAEKIYKANTEIILEQRQEVTLGEALSGSTRDPFNDKIAYFKSPALAMQVVDELKLNYVAIAEGRVKDKDLYTYIRWELVSSAPEEKKTLGFTILPKGETFQVLSEGSSLRTISWNTPFVLNNDTLIVRRIKPVSVVGPITCYLQDRLASAFSLSRSLSIGATANSNILRISISDNTPQRAVDVLNAMVKRYNRLLNEEKSATFSQAIAFVDERLGPLSRELDSMEYSLASYKSQRGLVGESANGELYLSRIREVDNKLNQIAIQEATLNSVETFINSPMTGDEQLAILGLADFSLQNSIAQYQQLRRERDKLALIATASNPNLILLEKSVAEAKQSITIQLDQLRKNIALSKQQYNAQLSKAQIMLQATPEEERELLSRMRFRNIKESLFLTLLQKREEAGLARASISVNTKIISPPVMELTPVKPSVPVILMIGGLSGFVIPLIIALLLELTNNRITSSRQMETLTNLPVIGQLEFVKKEASEPFVIGKGVKNMIGEQIRSLRTQISFYNREEKCKFILITSSMSGEGKSFLSLNLARSYSIQGARVAILEFDMRRPKIAKYLNMRSEKGLSNVLSGTATMEEIAYTPVKNEPDFKMFPAGIIPPNPQELLSGRYFREIKEFLDENFDVVVIDTPPFGLVADAQLLGSWADLTIIITRFRLTIKEQVEEIQEWKNRKFFRNMALVLNGIERRGYYGYKYGYYYYRGKYGYNYYHDTAGKKK